MTDSPVLENAGDLPVFCAHHALIDPKSLKLYPENPNEHPPEQIEIYLEVLRNNGFRRPAIVSRRSGFVTKGNGLVLSALHGLLPLVPVEYQHYDTEADEIADVIADNRLHQLSKFNNKILTELLVRLDDGTQDMRRTGYQQDELEDLMCRVGTLPEPRQSEELSPPTGTASDVANVPISHTRMVQLFLNEETMPLFIQRCEELGKVYGTKNITDTAFRAVKEAFEREVK